MPWAQPSIARALQTGVRAFLQRHDLHDGDGPLLAGVSGGPDSVCLLHALWALREAGGPPLAAAHANHQLRGEESVEDQRYVEGLCARFGIPLEVGALDVKTYRRERRLSLEEAARVLRHRFLAEAARRAGARAVVLAHTADDQAETVLMHVLRGAGPAGLRGMEPIGVGTGGALLARPLLDVTREEVEAYCREVKLDPRRDTSNLSADFTRNRVRHHLLPELRKFNPRVREALLRTAGSASEVIDLLDAEVQRWWPRVALWDSRGLAIDAAGLSRLPGAVSSHLLRRAVREARGNLQGITFGHIAKLKGLASGPTGKRLRLPGGSLCENAYGVLRLTSPDTGGLETPGMLARRRAGREVRGGLPTAGTSEQEVLLAIPGTTSAGDWLVRASLLPRGEAPADTPLAACMDGSLGRQRLWVRSRREGDRFRPLGARGSKKLQDFFVDAKVPRRLRDQAPLVCGEEGILWVVGHRLAEPARVQPESATVLRLEFSPAAPVDLVEGHNAG